jgi:hypothetical protein
MFWTMFKAFSSTQELTTLALGVLQTIILTSKDKTFDVNKDKTHSKEPLALLHIRITCPFPSK